jgi:hypothetical protein
VIDSYWRDFEDHRRDFRPTFLVNDISRFWKGLCVSYEAAGPPASDEEKAKRRLNNYKLKHSRLLTCYSALLYLASLLRHAKSVSREDAFTMATLTPLDRLLAVREANPDRRADIDHATRRVRRVPGDHGRRQERLARPLCRRCISRAKREEAHRFGDLIFDLLSELASKSPLFRYLLV